MIAIILFILLLIPLTAEAQTYETLQMIRPVASGAAGTGLHASNRVYRAYTGIEYNIHADARGGKWPYSYSLSNAPSGMTIEAGPCTVIGPTCTAGTITWTSPTGTASNIVVTVRDSLGTEVTGTWTVTSSTTIGADGFCFVDVNNAAGGRNGSLANPYNTLLEVYNSCGARSVLYLRSGTYATSVLRATCALGGDGADYGYICQWADGSDPLIWIGYPGETAVIDFGSTGSNDFELISTSSSIAWIDNLEIKNVGNIGFRFNIRNGYGSVVRRITAHDLNDGNEELNTAFFMWSSATSPDESYWDTVQNSTFTGIFGDGIGIADNGCALKTYGVKRAIVETSSFDNSAFPEAIVAIKSSTNQVTIRAMTCGATTGVATCIGGNMAKDTGQVNATSGEMYHNLLKSNTTGDTFGAITMVQNGVHPVGVFRIYRNTIIGQWLAKQYSVAYPIGPATFYDNVIVNGGGSGGSCPLRALCVLADGGPIDYTQWVDNGDNVLGANDGTIANATTGVLVGSSRTTYLGVAGFELLASTGGGGIGGRGSFGGTVRLQ